MTRDLTAEERALFNGFYREVGSESMIGWRVWNLLFDSPTASSPNSPQYWAARH